MSFESFEPPIHPEQSKSELLQTVPAAVLGAALHNSAFGTREDNGVIADDVADPEDPWANTANVVVVAPLEYRPSEDAQALAVNALYLVVDWKEREIVSTPLEFSVSFSGKEEEAPKGLQTEWRRPPKLQELQGMARVLSSPELAPVDRDVRMTLALAHLEELANLYPQIEEHDSVSSEIEQKITSFVDGLVLDRDIAQTANAYYASADSQHLFRFLVIDGAEEREITLTVFDVAADQEDHLFLGSEPGATRTFELPETNDVLLNFLDDNRKIRIDEHEWLHERGVDEAELDI